MKELHVDEKKEVWMQFRPIGNVGTRFVPFGGVTDSNERTKSSRCVRFAPGIRTETENGLTSR